MTNVFRDLIESALQTLEAGAFQDFALEFLPLVAGHEEVRNSGTGDG